MQAKKIAISGAAWNIRLPGFHMFTACDSQLEDACLKGDLVRAQRALADGARVDGHCEKYPQIKLMPLSRAIGSHNRELICLLLSHGANPNGPYAMHMAATGPRDILQLVVDAGGDVNSKGETGWPTTFVAANSGNMRFFIHHPLFNLQTWECPHAWEPYFTEMNHRQGLVSSQCRDRLAHPRRGTV